MAFNVRENFERIPHTDLSNKYKIRFKKIPFADVKKMVKEIREKREKEKMDKMIEANEKYLKKMRFI